MESRYCSRALDAIISFVFKEMEVNRVAAWHDLNKANLGKVIRKCGLKYEGTLRQSDYNNQGIVDACYYSLLAIEYQLK